MTSITFNQIHRDGQIVKATKEYEHFHDSEFLSRYDSNLIAWKCMPSTALFKEIEVTLSNFHLLNNQKHLKFIFPPNEKLTNELHNYLLSKNYSIGFLELYSIQPKDFKASKNTQIEIQFVKEENIEDFLQLQYHEDLQFGESFATEKQVYLRKQYIKDNVYFIIAYDQMKPIGSVIIIQKDNTAEIDNLFVLDSHQRKGIGSSIQHFVMEHFHNKTITLVADGEDTPREMYQRQNYRLKGFQYEALKVQE
ncbi:GNAT family N-acetyltransferase [Lysinibacillus sp. SGAir0095]|uniref:GNAT family N-acetyltransferase n=1 Tax=Lysinibacillus sp. SGAir0095 TaxID=2070463 RepID=UPI0010CCF74A|nr:GNAT family N-acetyltransferase [Lysinibacillus sp. SGAir0095]QCR33899.1 GNAT family N-acetyltransferase [Lysinibacillus sp. SGAir0095]